MIMAKVMKVWYKEKIKFDIKIEFILDRDPVKKEKEE